MESDDAALLSRVARGDSGALTRLYQAHSGRLFGYLLRLAGDRMTAEEILQDTMLAVWRSAGTYADGSTVTTWLFGVARRQAYTGCAARRRRRRPSRWTGPIPRPAPTSWPSRRPAAHRWPARSASCPTTTGR